MNRPMISPMILAYAVLLGAPLAGCGGGGVDPDVQSTSAAAAAIADSAVLSSAATPVSNSAQIADDMVNASDATSAAASALDAAIEQRHADGLTTQSPEGSDAAVLASTATAIDAGAAGSTAAPVESSPDPDPIRVALAVASDHPASLVTSAIKTAAKPLMERVEQVANDGASETAPIPNHWGMHQPRISSHADGTVRALYLKAGADNQVAWQLMKRDKYSGVWVKEASGLSQDDVTLSRDPVSDVAHVLAWPKSVPTVFSSPAFGPRLVPGTWQNMATTARHYGNTGVGADGLYCLKVSVEQSSAVVPTTGTSTQFNCGRYNSSTTLWTWAGQQTQFVGLRSTYDYVFPGGFGVANRLVGTTQLDLYKAAASLLSLSASQGNYVFNGVNNYTVQIDSPSTWKLSVAVAALQVPSSSSTAPVERQIDAYIDRSKRQIISYQVDGSGNASDRGIYYRMSDATGNTFSTGKWPDLPSYGYVRVFDDAKGRMWLLWSNLGLQSTQLNLYRVQLVGSAVTLVDKTDLSASLAGYAIQGSPLLTLPRGGHSIGNAVDGQIIACDGQFANGKLAACYPSGVNKQRILHFRLRLPD